LSQALDLGQLLLPLAQDLLLLPALGDVLDGAERSPGPARVVPDDVALAVDDARFAVGTDDSVFDVVTATVAHRLGQRPAPGLAIVRVDPFLELGKGERALLRL
jgi:hypothetical protein